jgi:hypothetical protein
MSTTSDTYAPWHEEPEDHRDRVMRIFGRGGRNRADLPYGCWTCADGRQVLFNRDYLPIVERAAPGQASSAADVFEWVPWFYNDSNPPWNDRTTKKNCQAILAEWSAPSTGGAA